MNQIPNNCQRCGLPMMASIMSRFNTQQCCMDCIDKEKAHPKYAEAEAAELAAVRSGQMNYPGIGKPADL